MLSMERGYARKLFGPAMGGAVRKRDGFEEKTSHHIYLGYGEGNGWGKRKRVDRRKGLAGGTAMGCQPRFSRCGCGSQCGGMKEAGMGGAGMKTRDEVMKGTEDEWKVWGRLDEGKGKGKGIV